MVTDEDGYGSGGTRRLKMVDRDGDDEEMEMLRSKLVLLNSTTEAEYVAAVNCYLLTKAFDVSRFNFLNASIGMLNL
ncbi:hypothetical protein Tco_1193785 [Tanacetum coccineum]